MIISARHGVIASTRSKPTAVAPTDPNFADVVLLLHMDGANGGTSFPDNSNSAHTVTAVGNANTNTSVKKFGTASLQEDGNGDYLSIPDSSDFDIGLPVGYSNEPFTIEFWARLNSTGGTQMFLGKGGGSASWNSSTGFQYIFFIQSSILYFQFWQSDFHQIRFQLVLRLLVLLLILGTTSQFLTMEQLRKLILMDQDLEPAQQITTHHLLLRISE
jgi:hypothetical protein